MNHGPKGNVNGEMREMMGGQTINETCEWCEESIESEMCINMYEMDKRWNEDLEKGDDLQIKAIRKWNEWWSTHISITREIHITNDGMVDKTMIRRP